MVSVMKNAGLIVKEYPYDVYLPKEPGTSLIEIVTPLRTVLTQQENILEKRLLFKGSITLERGGTHFQEVEMLLQKLSMQIMAEKRILNN